MAKMYCNMQHSPSAYSQTVRQSDSQTVRQSYSHAVIQSCSHTVIQSYSHAVMQSFSHTVISHTVIQSDSHTVIQCTAVSTRAGVGREQPSCVASPCVPPPLDQWEACCHLSTNERPAATSRPMRGGLWSCHWPGWRHLPGSMMRVMCRQEGVGAPARRLRSSGIQSREPHETLLTCLFSENERRRARWSGIQSHHDEGLTDMVRLRKMVKWGRTNENSRLLIYIVCLYSQNLNFTVCNIVLELWLILTVLSVFLKQ